MVWVRVSGDNRFYVAGTGILEALRTLTDGGGYLSGSTPYRLGVPLSPISPSITFQKPKGGRGEENPGGG